MAANLDQIPADGSQRVVIRPQKSIATTFSISLVVLWLFGAGIMLIRGTVSGALLCLALGGLFLYAVLGSYLWVDAERVGVRRLPWGASCRRDELARMQIISGLRGVRRCEFVRKNGHIAFYVPKNLYGATQLQALARSLGVEYYDLFSGGSPVFPPFR